MIIYGVKNKEIDLTFVQQMLTDINSEKTPPKVLNESEKNLKGTVP